VTLDRRRRIVTAMVGRMAMALAVVCASAGCSEDETSGGTSITPETAIEQRVHLLVNQHRDSLGLAELVWSEFIADLCRIHSYQMGAGIVPFGHDGFEERGVLIADSIPHSASAENVLRNYGGADPALAAVQTWLNSSGHRANIEGAYNMTGIGVVVSSDSQYYFTQFFIRAH
jgi:uncharacterized protein YkwD